MRKVFFNPNRSKKAKWIETWGLPGEGMLHRTLRAFVSRTDGSLPNNFSEDLDPFKGLGLLKDRYSLKRGFLEH